MFENFLTNFSNVLKKKGWRIKKLLGTRENWRFEED